MDKSVDQKEEQTEEAPKEEDNGVNVRNVCVCFCVSVWSLHELNVSSCLFVSAGEDQATDFSFGQNQRLL